MGEDHYRWTFAGKVPSLAGGGRCVECEEPLTFRRYDAIPATFVDCAACRTTWEIWAPPLPGWPTVDLLEPSAHRSPRWRRILRRAWSDDPGPPVNHG